MSVNTRIRDWQGYGVVAVMKNGPGPTVLVRADLDALPVEEQTGLPYASQVRARDDSGTEVPVMHACGHDIHLTVLIGTARMLASMKDRWRGTLVLVGQPSEEKGDGARALLADGLYTRFPDRMSRWRCTTSATWRSGPWDIPAVTCWPARHRWM